MSVVTSPNNLSKISNNTNGIELVSNINTISGGWLIYGLIIIIYVVSIISMRKRGYDFISSFTMSNFLLLIPCLMLRFVIINEEPLVSSAMVVFWIVLVAVGMFMQKFFTK